MSGPKFHETQFGQRFFNKQLPELIKAINRLAEATEQANDTNLRKVQMFQSAPLEQPQRGYICKDVYTPQTFLEEITGNCYTMDGDDDTITIHQILKQNGLENDTTDTLWDYPLEEIDEVIEANTDVVLVEVCRFDENNTLVKEYRWFEIPDGFVERFKEKENA